MYIINSKVLYYVLDHEHMYGNIQREEKEAELRSVGVIIGQVPEFWETVLLFDILFRKIAQRIKPLENKDNKGEPNFLDLGFFSIVSYSQDGAAVNQFRRAYHPSNIRTNHGHSHQDRR